MERLINELIIMYGILVRLLKYSVCKTCGAFIKYSGSGGVRRYCDNCKPPPRPDVLTCAFCGKKFDYSGRGRPKLYCSDACRRDSHRLNRLKYMDIYRKRLRNMIYG